MQLAVPVALTQLAILSMQLVDTIFVGRLGAEALGGVGLASAFFGTLLIFGLGLLFGMDYPVSYAFGAGKVDEANEYLLQGIYLSTAVSLPLIGLMYVSAAALPHLGIAPSIASEAARYLEAVSWSLWPNLVFLAFRQYLQAMGIANPVVVILILANLLNAFGNWLFIFGNFGFPRMEVVGSAISTDIARVFMMVSILLYVFWLDCRRALGLLSVPLRISIVKLRSIAHYGIPASGQVLLEVGVFSFSTFLAGLLGAVPLAAHQIVLQVASFVFMIPLGIGSSAAVRVAQALGRENPRSASNVGSLAILTGGGLMASVGILIFLSSRSLLQVFTQDVEVIRVGTSLLVIVAFFQLSDGLQVVSTGALRGIGDTRTPMLANLIGHWFIGLPIGALLCFGWDYGIFGIWIGLSIGLTCVAASLVWVWRKKTRLLARTLT